MFIGIGGNSIVRAGIQVASGGGGGSPVVGATTVAGDGTAASEYLIDNPSTGPDQLIVIFFASSTDLETDRITVPNDPGFTTVYRPSGGSYRNQGQHYAWKISDGTEGAQISFYSESGSNRYAAVAVAIQGVDTTNPIAASEFLTTASGNPISTPPATTPGDFHLGCLATYYTRDVVTPDPNELATSAYTTVGVTTRLHVGGSVENNGFAWQLTDTRFHSRLNLSLNLV